jgi:hypothetical protein
LFKYVLSYPSKPRQGKFHEVHPQNSNLTLCKREIPSDWPRYPEGVLYADDHICKNCVKKGMTTP